MNGLAVFDLDGTLADTSGDLIAAANACFRSMGEVDQLHPERDARAALRGGRAMLTLGFERLGRGGTMQAAMAATSGHVAEGVTSCQSVLALAASYDVEMPLTEAVHRVCHKGLSVDEAVALLLGRSTKPE